MIKEAECSKCGEIYNPEIQLDRNTPRGVSGCISPPDEVSNERKGKK
jgi:hypothetical protein